MGRHVAVPQESAAAKRTATKRDTIPDPGEDVAKDQIDYGAYDDEVCAGEEIGCAECRAGVSEYHGATTYIHSLKVQHSGL
jgi:hypothetical protein